MKFTLKIVLHEDGKYFPYTKHYNGGIDLTQMVAFHHIFNNNSVDYFDLDYFLPLIGLHGWTLETVKND